MSIDLGIPVMPPPTLAPRRPTRKIKVGKVFVGGDAPISVQSMTTTLTADINSTLQQIAELTATGCDIVRVAVPSSDDADALLAIATKSQIPVIADIHFQPKYVFAAIDAGCAAVRVNPGQHPGVRRPGQGHREGGRRPGHLHPDRGQRRLAGQAAAGQVRQGDPRGAGGVRAVGGQPVRGARLPRFQDQRQAQRPGDHGPRVRVAQRGLRLSAAPRRHRGRARLPGHDQVGGGLRRPAVARHRRHHSGLPVRAAGRRGQGRDQDLGVPQPPAAAPGDRVLPVLRPGPGRRLQAGRRGDRGARRPGGAAAGRRDGLRGERPRGGAGGRSRRGVR